MKKFVLIFLWVFVVYACEEIINEENITEDVIVTLAPANSSALKTNEQINYNWQPISGASNYELQVATPSFDQATQIQLDTIITGTTFTLDSLKTGSYEWRVRALNGAFQTEYVTNDFTVEN